MNITEEHALVAKKLAPLNERLVRQYGVSIDLSTDRAHLLYILEHYSAKRQVILAEQGETAALQNDDYRKAVLISETVRLYLREIAPKRRNGKRK